MAKEKEIIYVARQPILNKNQKIIGYEILYRDTTHINRADITDHLYASSKVIVNIFNHIGIGNLVGDKKAFINVGKEIIEKGFLNLLTGPIVLEVLESTEINPDITEYITNLKTKGFEIALDDFTSKGKLQSLVSISDYIKIDIQDVSESEVENIINSVKKENPQVKLIAEKVETKDEFERCKSLNFDLFQGFFFQEPKIVEKRKLDPSETTLIRLFNKLGSDFDIKEIEEIISTDVKTYLNLLKFVNSAFFYFQQEIRNLRHAICLIGARNLRTWIILMLSARAVNAELASTLVERILYRGKFMENLAYEITKNKDIADMAYMVGMLSLVETALRIPQEELLEELNLHKEIKLALTQKAGLLGKLLLLVEFSEKGQFDKLNSILEELNINLFTLSTSDLRAFKETQMIITGIYQ